MEINQHIATRTKTFLPLALFLLSYFLSGCSWFYEPPQLPAPDEVCAFEYDWQGIKPGISSQKEVIELIGLPSKKGNIEIRGKKYPFYGYDVLGGSVGEYVQDRIFFRPDGIVDWIEVIEADRSGVFKPVLDTVNDLGTTLDYIYVNNNFDPTMQQIDVLSGPDQIYVWAECGFVLDALKSCYPIENSNALNCSSQDYHPGNLTIQKPIQGSNKPNISVENAVLMKILFSPTTYEGFVEHYEYKIPFGIWDPFLHSVDFRQIN